MCGIAIVGCGYVVDFYLATLAFHSELRLEGVFDTQQDRSNRVALEYGVRAYGSLAEVLSDSKVELVVNLTGVDAHFEVSERCLLAGKHVYSEKPLAKDLLQARELGQLAQEKGLVLTCAPCSALGAAAQTIKSVLDSGELGNPQLVYAELDDGPIHVMPHSEWKNRFDVVWPFEDEMNVGCVMEHAGYYLTWLVHFFGKAVSVTSFSRLIVPGVQKGLTRGIDSPDFSVACIEFESKVVARLTCGIVAPEDHSLTIVCERGTIRIANGWNYGTPVIIKRYERSSGEKGTPEDFSHAHGQAEQVCPLKFEEPSFYNNTHNMDFARGIAETARLIKAGGKSVIDVEHAIHVLEIVEMMNQNGEFKLSAKNHRQWVKDGDECQV